MNIEKVWHLFQNKVLEKFCFHLLLRYLFQKNFRQNSNLPPSSSSSSQPITLKFRVLLNTENE